jgi:hypothetical protein
MNIAETHWTHPSRDPQGLIHRVSEIIYRGTHEEIVPRVRVRHRLRSFTREAARAPALAAVLQPGAAARESRVRYALITTQRRCLMNNVLDHNT